MVRCNTTANTLKWKRDREEDRRAQKRQLEGDLKTKQGLPTTTGIVRFSSPRRWLHRFPTRRRTGQDNMKRIKLEKQLEVAHSE